MIQRVLIYFAVATLFMNLPTRVLAHEPGPQISVQLQNLILQYELKLGPFQDPFAFVYEGKQADRVFQRMCQRATPSLTGSLWRESPLGMIRGALQRGVFNFPDSPIDSPIVSPYDATLVEMIFNDAQELLTSTHAERLDLQANLLALKFTGHYLRKFQGPESGDESLSGAEGSPADLPEGQSQGHAQDQEGEGPRPEKDSPEYPSLAQEYKPFTKDTSSPPGSGSKKQFRIAEVNFTTSYFGQRYMSEIVRGVKFPFREVSLPSTFPAIGKFAPTPYTLTIRTFGKTKVPLFIPPLYHPLQPADSRILLTRSPSGGYELEFRPTLPEHSAALPMEIQIPLLEEKRISLSPPLRDLYTQGVGFAPQEWPEALQAAIFRKFPAPKTQDRAKKGDKNNSLEIAQAINDYISEEHLYSVGAQTATDPTEALKHGAFQCDLAAYAMVGLLRDFYKIPCRVVGGYRAKKFRNGNDGKSYLVLPGEAHVWVEVFFEETTGVGRWVLYDPTPTRKDTAAPPEDKNFKRDNSGEERDEYGHNPLKKAKNNSTLEDPTQKPGAEQGTPEKGGADEKDSDPEGKAGDALANDLANGLANDLTQQLSHEDLVQQLEIGSLSLKPPLNRNPLHERVLRTLLRTVLEPDQGSVQIQNRLQGLSSLTLGLGAREFTGLLQEATRIHSNPHPDLKSWLERLAGLASRQDVNKTYEELFHIRQVVELYARFLDRSDPGDPGELNIKPPISDELITSLRELLKKLHSLAHVDSPDIALVSDLVQGLPAVARMLLKERFDFTEVGANPPTRDIAEMLKAGKMNDLRLISQLAPLSNFVLNSSTRPGSTHVKTWQRDSSHPRGRDLLPLQRFSDLSRSIFAQPGRGVEENIRNETAYVLTRRKRVPVPTGQGEQEAERITIVLYDTSGSMSGDPARFQAGLISAFTARALSDVAPSGRLRHRVVLVPFDDKVGTPIRVTHPQEALAVLSHSSQVFRNTGGGTNIQKALIQAMALIADAEQRAGEPLAAANIILMTDGQSTLDSVELAKARQAIDRQTPLQTLFIAINQSSEALRSFAMASPLMGKLQTTSSRDQGFYREFGPAQIQKILAESDHLDLNQRQNRFYTDKVGKDLPQEFHDDLYKVSLQARAWLGQLSQLGQLSNYLPPHEHLKRLEQLTGVTPVGYGPAGAASTALPRPLEKWLIQVRKLVVHPVFSDKRLLGRVLHDLITHFEALCGVRLSELSEHELEQLRHLYRTGVTH